MGGRAKGRGGCVLYGAVSVSKKSRAFSKSAIHTLLVITDLQNSYSSSETKPLILIVIFVDPCSFPLESVFFTIYCIPDPSSRCLGCGLRNCGSRGELVTNGPPSLITPMRYTSTTDRKSDTVSSAELWEPGRTRGEWAAIFDQSYGVHFYHGSQKQHSKFCRTLGAKANTWRMGHHL